MGTVLPAIFLGVAAFLLNVVISRLVATQREQIAALKALGYPNRAIAAHYLKMVGAITALGFALGIGLGRWLGSWFLVLYVEFFRLPVFEHRLAPGLVAIALGLTLVTAVAGTLNAIAATVRLAPAEAMRPPAPGRYRRTLLERLGITGMATSLRMILREMERKPLRTGLSIGGVAVSVAIVVMGNFFRDAIEYVVDSQFHVDDAAATSPSGSPDPAPDSVRHEVARLPGVLATESTRYVPVRLVNGHRSERVEIRGLADVPQLEPHRRRRQPRAGAARRRPGAHRPPGRQARPAPGRPRARRGAGRPGAHAHAAGAGHREGDDGPERLHAARRAQSRARRRRPDDRLRPRGRARARGRAARRHARTAARRRRLQQGDAAAQHGGDQRAQRPHHEHRADAVCRRHRGRRGLQQRAHRAGRAHLGAGQPARARLHPRRGLGAAAGRAGASRSPSRCRWACCWAGGWCT